LNEERFYDSLRRWLEGKGYYCGEVLEYAGGRHEGEPFLFQDKGTRGGAGLRIDVAGVKNVGTQYEDEIEVVSIEVRDKDKLAYRNMQDAYAYSRCSHKCYLATTAELSDEDKRVAEKLGIGLIKLTENRPPKEVKTPRLMDPDYSQMMLFLNRLEIARCAVCGCFFETWSELEKPKFRSYYSFTRPRYFKVAHESKSINIMDKNDKLARKNSITRYICKLCMEEFFLNKYFEKSRRFFKEASHIFKQ
jgi:hypothetical protein